MVLLLGHDGFVALFLGHDGCCVVGLLLCSWLTFILFFREKSWLGWWCKILGFGVVVPPVVGSGVVERVTEGK